MKVVDLLMPPLYKSSQHTHIKKCMTGGGKACQPCGPDYQTTPIPEKSVQFEANHNSTKQKT
jgi:hypothetical protein